MSKVIGMALQRYPAIIYGDPIFHQPDMTSALLRIL